MARRVTLNAGSRRFVFDLAVIVCGITLSFLLNEWRLDRIGGESIRRDLSAIQVNLESDRRELTSLIDRRKEVVPSMRELIRITYEEGDAAKFGSLMEDFWDGVGFSFYPDSGAWRAIVASGNMRWLDSGRLKAVLFDYYDHAVPRIEDNNRLVDDLIVKGVLRWLSGEFPPRSQDDGQLAAFTLADVDPATFRRQIGGALPHTEWYDELLGITLEQLDAALAAVRLALSE